MAKPIKHISPTEVHTQYEMDLPWPLSVSRYVHGSILQRYEEDKRGYKVKWYLVESDTAKSVNGEAIFIPLSNNRTLMKYRSHMDPTSIFAGLIKNKMFSDVKKSIDAIVNHIEFCTDEKEILTKYTGYIERALKGEKVYQHLIK